MAEKYFKLQEDIFKKISNSMSNFRKSPKDRISVAYVETRLEALEKSWSSFINNHDKLVLEIDSERLQSSNYQTDGLYEQTEELYFEYKSLLKSTLSKFKSKNSDMSKESTESEHTAVKLPKISIPKFSGNYFEWVSFRDLFTSLIHKNSSIDDVQKLHYLKSYITGEAEQLLRYIPVTADNYQICWTQLESRYNNKRYLANNILKKLTNQKCVSSETASGIKQLLDNTKECLSALTNIGVDVSNWDTIVIYLVSQKLDFESRKQWEQKISDSIQDLPSFTQFEEFLQNRFRALEFIDTRVQRSENKNCTRTHIATTILTCVFCTEGHKLANCKKFVKEHTDARRDFVQTNHLCFNCLGSNHSVYQCTLPTRCRLCKRKHHTLLHPKGSKSADEKKADQSVNSEAEGSPGPSHSHTHGEVQTPQVVASCFTSTLGQVLLATALVKVESPKTNSTFILRSLLDQGSQASFITEAAVQMIGLKKIPGASLVSGLGGDQATLSSRSSVVLKIQSRLDPSFTIIVKAHVLSKLTTFLPSRKVSIQVLPTLPTTELADPFYGTPNKIDLLLGAEVYSQILLDGLIKDPQGAVVAQRTTLGWILSGKIRVEGKDFNRGENCLNVVSLHLTQPSENELLKKFWELESEPSFDKSKLLTPEEKKCEDLFTQTTRRDEAGRFIVRLPFKTQDPSCLKGNLNDIALKRYFMLEKRLLRNSELKVKYSKILAEYLSSGHMEVVNTQSVNNSKMVYLPHHAVIRQERATTKVRMVVDASCTDSNGASLNGDLLVGPTLQPELRHLIMRWRRYSIEIVADLFQMYKQVRVADEDERYKPDVDLQHLRFLRFTFRTPSVFYLTVRCLQQVAYEKGNDYPLSVPKKQWHAWNTTRWKTLMANRASEILNILVEHQGSDFKQKPPNSALRGIKPLECVRIVLWNRGPQWLHLKEIKYSKSELENTDLEERKYKIKSHTTTVNNEFEEIISRFSSLTKLTRVLSFCRRVLRWKKPERENTYGVNTWLTVKEMNKTSLTCIKLCQRQYFCDDIESLEKTGNLSKISKLTSLSPFLDLNHVLRVGGRIQRAQINTDMKHCIILPHKSHLTKLVIDDAHNNTMHGGPQVMLNYLRSKYWVIGAKNLVRQKIHKCVICVRQKAEISQQLMGQLPAARVTASRAFHSSGVDYAGPINIRSAKGRGYHSRKGYICLFICMATKAIHLEVVSDMTAQSFIAAFKRFVARRGHVAELWSDNGTTFVGSARELLQLFSAERSSFTVEIVDWMASNGTDWNFIPPHSPNFGGLWEAAVKSTKYHLKRVIGDSTLTFEEMTTTLSQIEACLNSRPISQLSNNPEDPTPLTPGHFLVGEPLVLAPDLNYENANISSLRRWHLTQRMVQDFWRRWSHEYLTQLQHRYKWSTQVPEPEVGSVVLVKEDNLPPSRWLFGVITDKHPGSDKHTRVVTLRYKGNKIKRPLSKLIVLPVDT